MICENEAGQQREAERREKRGRGTTSLTVLESLVQLFMRCFSSCGLVLVRDISIFFFFAGLCFEALQVTTENILPHADFVMHCYINK